MERVILSFDESAYDMEVQNITKTAEVLNDLIKKLEENTDLQLTDAQKKKYFIDKQDPEPFINTLYPDQTKFVRDTIKESVRLSFREIFKNKLVYEKNDALDKLTISKGTITPNYSALELLKKNYETSLESERSKKAYDLHETAFNAIQELEAMAKEKGFRTGIMTWFAYDRELNLKRTEINYNRI